MAKKNGAANPAKQEDQTTKTWAIVEIFGHSRYAGLISEHAIGGCNFVRVDVPACGDQPEFTKLFGQGAIYSITPVSEPIARACVKNFQSRPLNVYVEELQEAVSRRRIAAADRDEDFA